MVIAIIENVIKVDHLSFWFTCKFVSPIDRKVTHTRPTGYYQLQCTHVIMITYLKLYITYVATYKSYSYVAMCVF